MKVIILSAGRSKRLKPVADKNLLKFNGKPLLLHKIESLALEGFTDFIVIAGAHNMNEMKRLTANLKQNIKVLEQKNIQQGMMGAVVTAEKEIKGDSVLIVSANDTVDQSLLKKLSEKITNGRDEAIIVGKKVDQYFPGGYLQLDHAGFILNIIEKPPKGTEPSDMINIVYHYYRNPESLLTELKITKSDKDDVYEKAVSSLIKKGMKIAMLPFNGSWHPIKFPWDIIETARFFAQKEKSNGIHPKAKIHKSSSISGDVIIDEGVIINANVVIQGPAYIGKNTIIGVNSFVRDSFIGENCVIGYASEVARSYIGDSSWTHTNYIGDSIIGSNVSFGAGSATGNLRLDEGEITEGRKKLGAITGDNIRVGINVSIMPGVKIGSNTMIGAGLIIAEDIPEESFVKGETKITIKKNIKPINPR